MTTNPEVWFKHYDKNNQRVWKGVTATTLKQRLSNTLQEYTHLEFDHVEIGLLGSRVAIFVTKSAQATVLYDRTRGFPSAKLLAALVLLGSK